LRHIHCKLLLALAFLLITLPALAEEKGVAPTRLNRVALVVGSPAYKVAPLRNPVSDTRTIRDFLKRTGFRASLLENASKRRLFGAVWYFGNSLRQSDTTPLYFSGHGLQKYSITKRIK